MLSKFNSPNSPFQLKKSGYTRYDIGHVFATLAGHQMGWGQNVQVLNGLGSKCLGTKWVGVEMSGY